MSIPSDESHEKESQPQSPEVTNSSWLSEARTQIVAAFKSVEGRAISGSLLESQAIMFSLTNPEHMGRVHEIGAALIKLHDTGFSVEPMLNLAHAYMPTNLNEYSAVGFALAGACMYGSVAVEAVKGWLADHRRNESE